VISAPTEFPPRARATWRGWAVPFGVTAFLLLSGPLPGRRSGVPGPRRLRGGWAFVLSMVVLGGVQGSL
jgi:hypothetical protein